ncbi:hypothetical protein AVEN_257364-1 [Araneus ventricosus]|uniref:Uncharacterized protein n=1 Tax=Araneus ventricosus TaxID=182803 RepID=A0A4Y2C923_ARAVE|nr:hypothetical protein AVEN_257364-1 [Araneus ventricosus]
MNLPNLNPRLTAPIFEPESPHKKASHRTPIKKIKDGESRKTAMLGTYHRGWRLVSYLTGDYTVRVDSVPMLSLGVLHLPLSPAAHKFRARYMPCLPPIDKWPSFSLLCGSLHAYS